MKSVNLTINGKAMAAGVNRTILEAATAAGIDIPTLCHHPALEPIGACRVCLVEVTGQRTLQPACTFRVTQGLVVQTESPKVVQARKFVLELIFSERNHFCMYCEMSGDCELQRLAYRYGLDHMTYPAYTGAFPTDATNKYFLLDHNRCVLCRRCMRACSELVANHTLDMRRRGAGTMVCADMDSPLGESSCISCGTCLDVCPTGALVEKRSAFMGRDTESVFVKTVCTRCSILCGVTAVTRGGNLIRVEGDWDSPVNRGVICERGRFEPLYDSRERVLEPRVRNGRGKVDADWDQALGTAAEHIRKAAPERLGVLVSSCATNEALFLLNEILVRRQKAGQAALLGGSVPILSNVQQGLIGDLDASDLIVVAGADPVRDHPVASFRVKRAVDKGARLILFGDEDHGLAPFAHRILNASQVDQVIDALESAGRPVVLYGAGLGEQQRKALEGRGRKASFICLEPGVNTRAALRFWPANGNGPDASRCEVLYVLAGEGPDGDEKELLRQIRKKAFVIVQASYASKLAERADVELPMAIGPERTGSLTSTDGTVQRANKVVEPAGKTRPDWEILLLLGEKLGVGRETWEGELLHGLV